MTLTNQLRRLRRYVRYKHLAAPDTRGDLKVLPAEIILIIAEHLSPASSLALGLTCVYYYNMLSPDFAKNTGNLTSDEREIFLQLLEMDMTKTYYCYRCAKLHPLKSPFLKFFDTCVLAYFYMASFSFNHLVRFPDARLVMNRHLYGPSHGLPLSAVEYNGVVFPLHFGGRRECTSRARIINDELFLKRTLTFSDWCGRASALQKFMNSEHFDICMHISTTYPSWGGGLTMPELRNSSDGFVECRDSLGSCAWCRTDYSISITREKARFGGWLIEIASYCQLGRCRSPFDWDWASMSECRGMSDRAYNEMARRVRYVESKPGMVRHCWSQQDDVVFPPGGGGLLAGRTPTNGFARFQHSEVFDQQETQLSEYCNLGISGEGSLALQSAVGICLLR